MLPTLFFFESNKGLQKEMKTFLGVALVLDLNRAKVVNTWEEEVLVGRLGSNR